MCGGQTRLIMVAIRSSVLNQCVWIIPTHFPVFSSLLYLSHTVVDVHFFFCGSATTRKGVYERQRAQSPFSPYANEMEMHAYVFVLRSRESKRVSVYANREDETSEKSVPNAHSNLRRELRASVKQVFFLAHHIFCVCCLTTFCLCWSRAHAQLYSVRNVLTQKIDLARRIHDRFSWIWNAKTRHTRTHPLCADCDY